MALPIAAIICIVLACWVVVVLIIFALYQLLKTRGTCGCECAPCGKEDGGGCSECCISLSESCNCCNPSVNGCLDSLCPGKKKISCVDLILCQCCANEGEESCCIKISCECDGCEIDWEQCPSCCQEQTEPQPEFQCPECPKCPDCTCHRTYCCYRCSDCFYGCCDFCYSRPDCSCCSCCDCCECACPFECNWTGPRCCEECCEPPPEDERVECCTCLSSQSDKCACCDFDEADQDRICLNGCEKTCDCCMWCYNWECVCRMCDPLLCDCCPKLYCSKACMSKRPYPYCFDYCGICMCSVWTCWKIGTTCSNMEKNCRDACTDVCLEGCDDFWKCCCALCCLKFYGFENCVICRCNNQGEGECLPLTEACVECIVAPVRGEDDDEPLPENPTEPDLPYCTKFSWFCFEIRRKRLNAETGITVLARDLSRIGYSMQFVDANGTVVDTDIVEGAILSQPKASEELSSSLGYTDSYGGYVSFSQSKTRAGSQHSHYSVGQRHSSHIHNTLSRLTPSLKARRELLRQFEESESILYNEKLQGKSSMMASHDSVRREIDFSDVSSDESEQESRTKLKIFRERESQTMTKIQENEEQIETIDKKLKKLKDSPLDTSNLVLYQRKLSEPLYRTESSQSKCSKKVSFVDEQPSANAASRHKRRQKSKHKSHSSEKCSSSAVETGRKNNTAMAEELENELEKTDPDFQTPGTSSLGNNQQPSDISMPSTITCGSDEEATPQGSRTLEQTEYRTSVDFEDENERGFSHAKRRKKKKSKSKSGSVPNDDNKSATGNKDNDPPSTVFLNVNETETESQVHVRRKKKTKKANTENDHAGGHETQSSKKKMKKSDGSHRRPATPPEL